MRVQCPKSCRVKFICDGDFAVGDPYPYCQTEPCPVLNNHTGSRGLQPSTRFRTLVKVIHVKINKACITTRIPLFSMDGLIGQACEAPHHQIKAVECETRCPCVVARMDHPWRDTQTWTRQKYSPTATPVSKIMKPLSRTFVSTLP